MNQFLPIRLYISFKTLGFGVRDNCEIANWRNGKLANWNIEHLEYYLNFIFYFFDNTYYYINALFNSIISKVILVFPIPLKQGESASTKYHFDIFWLGKNKFVNSNWKHSFLKNEKH